jgi:hypothetical protein
VAGHEFLFALDLPAGGDSDAMLQDLAARLLGHVGCGPDVLGELFAALRTLRDGSAAGRRCDLQFRAHDGELSITVDVGSERLCQISRPIR